MTLIWLDKLRGPFVQDDGVQVGDSGRVSTINFVNASISYNTATGVATIDTSGSGTLFEVTAIDYSGLGGVGLAPTDVENSPSHFLQIEGETLVTGYVSFSVNSNEGTLSTTPRVNAVLERSDNGSSWTTVSTSEIIQGPSFSGTTYGQVNIPPSVITNAASRRVRVTVGAHSNGGNEMLVIPSVLRLSLITGNVIT